VILLLAMAFPAAMAGLAHHFASCSPANHDWLWSCSPFAGRAGRSRL